MSVSKDVIKQCLLRSSEEGIPVVTMWKWLTNI